ncbi:ornithine cyclodeaminase [Sphingomonadaceae bacterium jetA1]|jgi:ornithine cyclodeaminase|uniref:ornithine cyclodeaminase n=1 Tax=Facivitalis istanbulensis TaxID=3075838 RepID=UPI003479C7F2
MTRFIGVESLAAIVRETGIDTFLRGLADYIEADFLRWPQFHKVPRHASHGEVGVVELMPIADDRLFGFKYVNGHPSNGRHNLLTVAAFGVLSDMATGYPRLMSEMTLLTALRTAATSALVARRLARPDSRVMAMIGLGAQSDFQALAFRALLGIERLRVYDIDPASTAKFVRNMGAQGFQIEVCSTGQDAVIGSDIITTATADKRNATILSSNMVGAGVHINAIGGDCPGKTELQRDILARARVFVELEEQTRIEGELQQMPANFPVTEIWQVLAGLAEGRTDAAQITLFDSVGFALEDFSALRYLDDLARGTAHAAEIDLIAEPAMPVDLFGLLEGEREPEPRMAA